MPKVAKGPYRELDVVWIRELFTQDHQLTTDAGSRASPRVGDTARIVAVLDAPYFAVEGVDIDGRRVWTGTFHSDELSRPPDAWSFEVREVSACVYAASGLGPKGESVRSTGSDPDQALADCRAFALRCGT